MSPHGDTKRWRVLAGLGGLSFWLFLGMASAGEVPLDPPAVAPAGDEALAARATSKGEVLEEKVVEGESAATAAPITRPEAEAVDPAGERPLDEPLTCLARTIYWEAKGEGQAGMAAVAGVVMNRLADPAFPKTLCEVVTQGEPEGPCQFSWWCGGAPIEVEERESHALAMEIARQALNGDLPDPTGGALFFHADDVAPDWVSSMVETTVVGAHHFYRPAD